jgi:signal transduction histidine kinase
MVSDQETWIRKLEKPLTVLTGSVALTILLFNLDFNFLEANLYDLRMAHGHQSRANQNIILVTLDDESTKELDEFTPLSMDLHVKFLEVLEKLHPRAVGYLIDLNEVQAVSRKRSHGHWNRRFVDAAKRMNSRGTVFLLGTPFDVTGEVLPPQPFESIPHSIAVVHKDGNVFSEDKVTRRALLTMEHRPAFHLELAQLLDSKKHMNKPRGSFYVPPVDAEYFFFRYHGSTVLCQRWECALPYPTYSFSDVLHRRLPQEDWKDKIILLGALSKDDSADFALTPYSKTPFTNPKLVVHANILDSILQNDGIIRAPNPVNWFITFGLTTSVLWWILTFTPLYGVFSTVCLAVIFIFISHFLFQFRGLWFRESQPLIGIFVAYYLAVPYRLIREYKTRWNYQRKHELLIQVEELKTNFLSLVTHDLKTPVARIQGLAEVLLRKCSSQFPENGREMLNNILTSTDELNRFITSILELSKIESNRLHLVLESKDINQLIERAIENFAPQAKARNILIQSDLEPLFPIKIDASLISKVLNNLIDNAIKYSPSDSEIRIESKEEKDWVVITVEDRGIGMTDEERQNLFTRFYRAQNETTSSIRGTGLGLYLTKYFIEAHRGHVQVKSEKNKGSVFKIYLPIQEGGSPPLPSASLTRLKEITYV